MCCRNGDGEDESLCWTIKARLENMFSDSHLAEDGFLLKHVLKNKHGYVSLKLLTCLKQVNSVPLLCLPSLHLHSSYLNENNVANKKGTKLNFCQCLLQIKALTTNWHTTLAAAQLSDLLELNDDGTKVRRTEPLPNWLLCSPTNRRLLIWNVSEEWIGGYGASKGLEHDSLLVKILQTFGPDRGVTSIWILRPGEDLPKELQPYAKHDKELGQHLCAVVKFDSLEGVRSTYSTLRAEEERTGGKGLCVAHLGFRSMRNLTKSESPEDKSRNQLEGDTRSQKKPLELTETFVKLRPSTPDKVFEESRGTYYPQLCPGNSMEKYLEKYYFQDSDRPSQTHSRTDWCYGDCSRVSPWVLRRRSAASAVNLKMTCDINALHLMQRVLRQPFGPDGSKGFYARRKPLNSVG